MAALGQKGDIAPLPRVVPHSHLDSAQARAEPGPLPIGEAARCLGMHLRDERARHGAGPFSRIARRAWTAPSPTARGAEDAIAEETARDRVLGIAGELDDAAVARAGHDAAGIGAIAVAQRLAKLRLGGGSLDRPLLSASRRRWPAVGSAPAPGGAARMTRRRCARTPPASSAFPRRVEWIARGTAWCGR